MTTTLSRPETDRTTTEDLVFVGAGVSTAYTLLALLERLERRGPQHRPLQITVVERSDDVFAGLAYGERSGSTSLVITTLKDFLAPAERALFVSWLEAQGDAIFEGLRREGGALSELWVRANREAIEAGRWDDLYLPRRLFGIYMRQRLDAAIAAAAQAGTATVSIVHGSVDELTAVDGRYELTVAGTADPLRAVRVVIAVGSPPNHAVQASDAGAAACVIDDPYVPSIGQNARRVVDAIRKVGPGAKVLFAGGNASIMEMLYLVTDLGGADVADAAFFVVNPRGALPAQLTDPDPAVTFEAAHLRALLDRSGVTAAQVHDAAVQDIETAEAGGLAIGDVLGPLGEAMGAVVSNLGRAEQEEFAGYWAVQIGRRQRRSGVEYSATARNLRERGTLHVIEGRFDAATGRVQTAADVPDRFDVVINGSGAAALPDLPETTLPGGLLASGLCRATAHGRGLLVNDDLEAAPGVYVMGPLLAGNVFRDRPIWHMEHCGRVEAYSQVLADTLVDHLS